ncbi:hypothetical protein D3C76_1470040 [compost metagenome]
MCIGTGRRVEPDAGRLAPGGLVAPLHWRDQAHARQGYSIPKFGLGKLRLQLPLLSAADKLLVEDFVCEEYEHMVFTIGQKA